MQHFRVKQWLNTFHWKEWKLRSTQDLMKLEVEQITQELNLRNSVEYSIVVNKTKMAGDG